MTATDTHQPHESLHVSEQYNSQQNKRVWRGLRIEVMLIGKTSALTMNVAGVMKDVVLIYLNVSIYG